MLSCSVNVTEKNALIKTILDSSFEGNFHPEDYKDLDKIPNIKNYIKGLI